MVNYENFKFDVTQKSDSLFIQCVLTLSYTIHHILCTYDRYMLCYVFMYFWCMYAIHDVKGCTKVSTSVSLEM